MNKNLFFTSAFYALILNVNFINAQVNYNDVAVLVNINDTMSVNIGNYFMSKRNIPANNLIRLNVSTNEEITPTQWNTLKQQVEDSIGWKGLNLNYIVTTKGVPLKVSYGGTLLSPDNRNASVDSELMLVGTGSSSLIGGTSAAIHTYYNKDAYFNSGTYGFYLVTRLTGYTQADVFKLIDNSGPKTYVNKNNVKFVLDQVATGGYAGSSHNVNLGSIHTHLKNNGWKDTLNTNNNYVKNQTNVLGYWSWGSNDVSLSNGSDAIPGNTWSKASIAETAVSTSARSFLPGTSYGQSLVADWIKEGCTGMSGFVYEPFLTAVADPYLLFHRYSNTTKGYNLAESFYMASTTISWMQIVVGDPKTSIVTTMTPVEEYEDNTKILVYPNPSKDFVQVDFELERASNVTISVTNMIGQEVYSEFLPNSNLYRQRLDVSNFEKGLYLITVTTGDKRFTQKVLVE